jgi:hypothetical protein
MKMEYWNILKLKRVIITRYTKFILAQQFKAAICGLFAFYSTSELLVNAAYSLSISIGLFRKALK